MKFINRSDCNDINDFKGIESTMIYLIVEKIRDFSSYTSNNKIEAQCELIMKLIQNNNTNLN